MGLRTLLIFYSYSAEIDPRDERVESATLRSKTLPTLKKGIVEVLNKKFGTMLVVVDLINEHELTVSPSSSSGSTGRELW